MNENPNDTVINPNPPNIVVCSDGTWNQGGAVNPTNVWRTYTVVAPGNQVKFHDNGVGTEGIRLLQIFGGAFGWGISQNLRELLAFVIQAYQPGSKIFLFGFSRGAFTVRVLAAILCRYGIPDKRGLKTAEDIDEVAAEMLECYKRENNMLWSANQVAGNKDCMNCEHETWLQSTESCPRCIWIRERSNIRKFQQKRSCFVNNRKTENKWDSIAEPSNADNHLVHFLGCWDTVEALGVPFEPLKKAAIYYFPLRFRNHIPSPKIKTVCHALSLDDERRSFHPICFDDVRTPGQTIHQTWFPGNHCHVGGGYSRDQMAMVPLKWMLEHAKKAHLKVNQKQLDDITSIQFSHGQVPSSRSGGNFFYGYHPRRIDDFQKNGPWSVHISAFHRLGNQIQSYLPTGIVFDFNDKNKKLNKKTFGRKPGTDEIPTGETPSYPTVHTDRLADSESLNEKYPDKHPFMEFSNETLPIPSSAALNEEDYDQYNKRMLKVNNESIWVGQVLWFACLFYFLLLFFWGFLNRSSEIQASEWTWLKGVFGAEQFALETGLSVLPAFIGDYFVQGLIRTPGFATLWLLGGLLLLTVCWRCRHVVQKQSFNAWAKAGIFNIDQKNKAGVHDESINLDSWLSKTKKMAVKALDGPLDQVGKIAPFINSPFEVIWTGLRGALDFIFKRKLVSWIFACVSCLVVILYAYCLLGDIWQYKNAVALGQKNFRTIKNRQKFVDAEGVFETSMSGFNTGFYLERGKRYQVRLTTESGAENIEAFSWYDWDEEDYPADPNGFKEPEKGDWFRFRFRVKPDKNMFRVLGKIGADGEYHDIGLNSEIVADVDGVLVVFVNEVMGFYFNNSGTAKVGIKLLED